MYPLLNLLDASSNPSLNPVSQGLNPHRGVLWMLFTCTTLLVAYSRFSHQVFSASDKMACIRDHRQ
ncbi:hypothetical protein K469DRAFT_712975 [Zopfia rhizophila CBS 207.26]|uniref:Uncharacterized protein n=1 Tax=Zopfia rhizophila CBS 207.26 TaxID=1314779 RepID=A0A6A6DQX3_9PEZI|nr:hypothetical protein K469DRAFT_712975 [Zopfia rhizophila CBS 207.26]